MEGDEESVERAVVADAAEEFARARRRLGMVDGAAWADDFFRLRLGSKAFGRASGRSVDKASKFAGVTTVRGYMRPLSSVATFNST